MGIISILLIVAVFILMMALRAFSLVEKSKKYAEIARAERQRNFPKNVAERADLLSAIIHNRLGLDPCRIPLESTWKDSLRIPAGELYEFFQDIDMEFMLDDMSALERQTTYGELLSFIGVTPEAMLGVGHRADKAN